MKFNLDEETRDLLRHEQQISWDKRVFVKSTVLLMLDQGCEIEFLAQSLGLEEDIIHSYVDAFTEKGLKAYLKDNWPVKAAVKA